MHMAHIVMPCIVMAYIVMAHIVMNVAGSEVSAPQPTSALVRSTCVSKMIIKIFNEHNTGHNIMIIAVRKILMISIIIAIRTLLIKINIIIAIRTILMIYHRMCRCMV